MLRPKPEAFQIRRLPMPDLPDYLSAKLSSIKFDELSVTGLGKNCWPVGHEAALYRHCTDLLVIAPPKKDTLAFFGVIYEPGIGANFSGRPPSELAAFAAWQAVAGNTLDVATIIKLNRALGGSQGLRKGRIETTAFSSGHKILFDCTDKPKEFLAQWLNAFREPCAMSEALARAIWLFLDFLIAHPFRDGNGRTARLLLQAFLHAKDVLPAPLLPLYPALLVNQRAFLSAAWAWELRCDPISIFEFMVTALIRTKEASAQLLQNAISTPLRSSK